MERDVILTLLLPWFPILLGVGVGARLLGRARGLFLGVICALFWIVLVQASAGAGIWSDLWTVASIVAGAVAIASMGAWSGQTPAEPIGGDTPSASLQRSVGDGAPCVSEEHRDALRQLAAVMEQFDDWLEEYREDGNPWPKFDELLRSVAYRVCKASHVRPYRLSTEGEELLPLREPDALIELERLPARQGIVGHVVTTGRSYLAGDPTQGEMVAKLAEESGEPITWCFAVRQGRRRLGVVTVGQLGIAPEGSRPLLTTVERLVGQFWCTLDETIRSRCAVQEDPVSALPTRPAFLLTAGQSLHESYQQGEPVAMVTIALEGMRELGDSGRWEVADDLVREVSCVLRRKVRMDDRLGRFDGSRFILLLRRVDSELASLIVSQLMSRVSRVCDDEARWRASVNVRCGLAGSGTENPDLRTLVFRALAQCRRARHDDVPLASDLGSLAVVSGGRA
jgi:diguanylate cyclase (GGDEF)-like protein